MTVMTVGTGKVFKSSHHLNRHVYVHTGAKPYSCRHCSDSFSRLDQLKTHLLKSHNEGTWFTGHICGKKLSRSDKLKEHEGGECPTVFALQSS